MNNPHFSSDEIHSLLAGAPAGGQPPARPVEELHRHQEECAACAELVRQHQLAQNRLQDLRTDVAPVKGPECPPEEHWLSLAAGLAGTDGEAALSHAATCTYCSGLLNTALTCLHGEATEEEEAFLDRLPADPGLAQRLHQSAQQPIRRKGPPSWTWAIAACLLAAAAGGWWMMQRQNTAPLGLLADAYSGHRTMEPRISGAQYAPQRVVRGAEAPTAALLEAQAKLDQVFARHSGEAQWLQARGLAELLSGRYDNAVDYLMRARRQQPDSTDVATDLAASYTQRALSQDRPGDLASAEVILTQVLSHGENPAAQFNLALIREQRQEWELAEQDWQRYLSLDPSSGWAGEAREHLRQVRDRRK